MKYINKFQLNENKCEVSASDNRDYKRNGKITIWKWNDVGVNQQYVSDIEIWKILNSEQIYKMFVLKENIEIPLELLNKNFTLLDKFYSH